MSQFSHSVLVEGKQSQFQPIRTQNWYKLTNHWPGIGFCSRHVRTCARVHLSAVRIRRPAPLIFRRTNTQTTIRNFIEIRAIYDGWVPCVCVCFQTMPDLRNYNRDIRKYFHLHNDPSALNSTFFKDQHYNFSFKRINYHSTWSISFSRWRLIRNKTQDLCESWFDQPLPTATAHRTATTNCSYSTIFQIRRLEFRNVKPVRNYFYSYIYTTCHF